MVVKCHPFVAVFVGSLAFVWGPALCVVRINVDPVGRKS